MLFCTHFIIRFRFKYTVDTKNKEEPTITPASEERNTELFPVHGSKFISLKAAAKLS